MSRCFPYPPPGYVCNRATGDALIESIKIEREKEKTKQERKEQKRREKEERKKEKKEKKREKEKLKSIQNIEGTHKRKRGGDGLDNSGDKSLVNSKEVDLPKKKQLEAEQLERSSVSEEHGQPVLTESLCYSSDGTQSNTKRSKIEQSPSNGNCTTQGKVFRFRLKRKEPENGQPADDRPSTSGRTVTPVTKMSDAISVTDEPGVVSIIPVPDKDTKGVVPVDLLDPNTTPAAHGSLSVEKSKKKPKSSYEAILCGWVSTPIQFDAVNGNDDEQWLFSCKKQAVQHMTCSEAYNGVSGPQCASTLWPRALLLPEADLYALPFTVPF
ncbi:hypothetical protein QQ045_000360 [Rhodiola kirilowii]